MPLLCDSTEAAGMTIRFFLMSFVTDTFDILWHSRLKLRLTDILRFISDGEKFAITSGDFSVGRKQE